MMHNGLVIEGLSIVTRGRVLKTARLLDEHYAFVKDPVTFVQKLKDSGERIDIFTFIQELHDKVPRYPFYHEWESMAMLPLTTYDNWFTHQINFKPRNKIRKAQKAGVEIRLVPFSDELVTGIRAIYNETPIRQGKRNWHYGKDFETIKRETATFLDQSDFIGAFSKDELIGFVKLTHLGKCSMLMNIVAKVSARDKAPTNALLAKSIEVCTQKNIPLLNYGIWGRRGLNDLKVANGFERYDVPRYFVPISVAGVIALRFGLHRRPLDYVPERWLLKGAELRGMWNEFRHGKMVDRTSGRASAASE